MKVSFNVLDGPWIPAVTAYGEEVLLGIRETLYKAHELREISSASPLEEYAVYRFLGLFLMDALRPESEFDIEDLLEAGRFDPEAIENYISLCRSEGVSFDLFDEKRPFLQSPVDEKLDGSLKPVSILDCTKPSGNNHTHFLHKTALENSLAPASAMRQLLTTYLFSTAAAQGYPSGVYGAPPYFGVIIGSSLFETLAHTLLPTNQIEIELDDPQVLWRRNDPVIPKRDVGKTSWLQGMLFPNRRIRLVPDEKGNASGAYLCQGENFINKESWRDPYVTYRRNKDKVFPMRPNSDRAIWRNLCDIIDTRGGTAAQLLSLYRELSSNAAANLTLYGVETNNASYLQICKHSLRLPLRILDSEDCSELLRLGIAAAEDLARSLGKALSSVNGLAESAGSAAVRQFYSLCENRFWKLCEAVSANEPRKELYPEYCDDLSALALRSFSSAVSSARLRAKTLAAAAEAQDQLYRSIGKLKKEAIQ